MYPMRPDNKKQKIIASFIVIFAVVMVTVGVSAYNGKQNATQSVDTVESTSNGTSTTPTTSSSTDTSSTDSTSTASSYKDGTYTASSSYYVPHGTETIDVTLTVQNGVVTNSSILNSESDRESARFQEDFTASYKSSVVGKSLSDIKLSFIAGASDTTDGFNEAVAKIQTQAQA